MTPALHVESAGAGPPLVLLHGWAMHSGLWGSVPEQLATRFRVHAVDLPGHGHSEPVAPCTLDAVTAAIAAAFEATSEPLTVVGWSLGGTVALRWARMAPGRIARLVLVAATPCFVVRDDWPHAMAGETLAQFGDELAASYRLTLQRFLSLQLAGSADGRAALAMLRRHLFARGDPAPFALAEALALIAATDLRADVPAIAQPTLVVAGGRDTLTPAAAGAWLAAALPNARLVTIAGAGHIPFLSHPAEFADALDGFFGAG
jgi:pimeloyl-[acyl-carrier protein] methyl ester esterase